MSNASVKGYDRLAPVYEKLERLAFGSSLMQARTALLNILPPVEHVLILGEGDGRFLKAFLERQPDCAVTVLEQSPKMVEFARSRLTPRQKARVTFLLEDAVTRRWEASRYDLVVTAFFLDCFTEEGLGFLIPNLVTSLRVGGLWYYADFTTPPQGWRKARGSACLSLMHVFFRWQTGLPTWRLADPGPFFERDLDLLDASDLNHGLLTCRLYRRKPGSDCIL